MSAGIGNLVELLDPSERDAIVRADGSGVTYAQLAERVRRVAGGLRALGLAPGERVVLLVPMSVELYVALLALCHVGATAVLVDPGADPGPLLARAAPVGFIGSAKAHLLRLKLPQLRGLRFYVSTGFTPLPHRRLGGLDGDPGTPDGDDHAALLTFTSGTTGAPKAMARSHSFLLAQHRALRHHMAIGPGDVDLPTLAVFLLHGLAGGATCVLADADLRAPGSVDAGRLVAQITRHGVTTTSGSPALFERLLAHGTPLPSLRAIYTGGGRVSADLLMGLRRLAPQAALYVLYGSTEAEPIAALDAVADLDALVEGERTGRGALVGTPVPAVRLRIAPVGTWRGQPVGEVEIAGGHVNGRYWGNPADPDDLARAEAQTAAHKRVESTERWHRTGDVGQLDAAGRLWLVGRLGEDVGGMWPLPIEGAAECVPGVRKAGLVEVGGEAWLAVQVAGSAGDWLAQVCDATGLPAARVVQVDAVPVDARHNTKVDRVALAAVLADRIAEVHAT